MPLTTQEYKKSFGNTSEEPADERTKEIETVDEAPAELADEPAEEIGTIDEAAAASPVLSTRGD